MKRKLCKSLCSMLLALAMVVGLMPGMGMTAYAAGGGTEVTQANVICQQYSYMDAGMYSSGGMYDTPPADITNIELADAQAFGAAVNCPTTYWVVVYAKDGDNLKWTSNGKTGEQTSTPYRTFSAWCELYNNDVFYIGGNCDPNQQVTFYFSKGLATVGVTGVSLNKETTTLTVGGTETLTATVRPDDATDKSVTWLSDNTNVATVDTNGLVTAVGVGTANITVTSNSDSTKNASCSVTVNPATYNVLLTGGSNATISGGSTSQSELSGAMETVTYTANSGYHFADFTDITQNGITVTKTSDSVVTVSGIPTADVNIVVPDAIAKTQISYTVTFNVENGSWNNGGSDAQTVTLTGYEGDTLTLAASQIPAVGSNPDATYKAGSWDTTPTAGMEITADTTFTYTYVAKTPISYTVTFNVENGSWNNGGSDAQTVTLTGYEGDTLTLAASQIPAVGLNPDATYKAGSWDTTPTAGMEITADTTFTYTYVAKTPISYTVTFNVENGSWDEGGSDAQTVTLTGYEGDTLTLAASQIPAVGSNPDATYKAGSWDTIPTAGMEITADTTFTYTYAAKTPISYTVTFNVENGSWNNGGSDAQTVTLTGYEGDTLNLAASQIPEVGSNPDATYKAGSWDTTPTAGMVITADTTFTYTYAAKTPISYTVTFNVENGSWDEGGSDAQTVTLTGYEGDTLTLAASQIPAVGSNPDVTYKAGSWDTTPTAGMEITADTTFTYSYVKDNTAPITYTNTEGEGSNYTLGTNGTLTFRFSRSENDAETINHFTGIKVDNIEVSSSNYTYSAGSVIINLKPEYLQTLSVGQHTLTAMFDDGGDVTVNFTIVAAAQNTPTPTPAPTPAGTAIASTGETFPMTVLYGIAMLIASVLCIAVMSFIKPKKYKVRKVKL